jgi:hypothetical protein
MLGPRRPRAAFGHLGGFHNFGQERTVTTGCFGMLGSVADVVNDEWRIPLTEGKVDPPRMQLLAH